MFTNGLIFCRSFRCFGLLLYSTDEKYVKRTKWKVDGRLCFSLSAFTTRISRMMQSLVISNVLNEAGQRYLYSLYTLQIAA